jgi:hypothetical protein
MLVGKQPVFFGMAENQMIFISGLKARLETATKGWGD